MSLGGPRFKTFVIVVTVLIIVGGLVIHLVREYRFEQTLDGRVRTFMRRVGEIYVGPDTGNVVSSDTEYRGGRRTTVYVREWQGIDDPDKLYEMTKAQLPELQASLPADIQPLLRANVGWFVGTAAGKWTPDVPGWAQPGVEKQLEPGAIRRLADYTARRVMWQYGKATRPSEPSNGEAPE